MKITLMAFAVIIAMFAAIYYFLTMEIEPTKPADVKEASPILNISHAVVGDIEMMTTNSHMGEAVVPVQGDSGAREVLKTTPYTRVNPFGLSTRVDPQTAALYDQNVDKDPMTFKQADGNVPTADLPVICHKSPYMLDEVCTTSWNKIPLSQWNEKNILVSGYTWKVV